MKRVKSSFTFRGGVHPDYRKDATSEKPVERLPLPRVLAVPLAQHLGAPAVCCVKAGDRVARGTLLGERAGFIGARVHAPAAGTVKAVENRAAANGSVAPAVVIETDPDSTEEILLPPLDWRTAAPDDLRARVNDAGVCGMGGAGFPTVVKLSPPPEKRCEYLVLNGAECEPCLTADDRLMRERAERVRTGAEILRRILGGPAVRVGVEANKPEALAALEAAFADMEGNVELVELPVLYPQGSEKHLVYSCTGRVVGVPPALPIDAGCVVENVATAAAVADAVTLGRALTERVVTVTGDAVNTPKNILAPVGAAFADLVDFCGGLGPDTRKIVAGGPMMGFAVPNLDAAVTKTTSGLLLLSGARVFRFTDTPCINCGRCLRACPMRLDPAAISRAVEADDIAAAGRLHVAACVECGACAYSCPARRSLTQHCRRAKTALRARRAAEQKKAQDAAQASATKG